MVEDPDELRLEFERVRGRWRATARRLGAVVYIDVLDPASARQRRAFAAALAGRDPRADAAAVDAELLRLADRAAPDAPPPPAPAAEPDEIDASRVARPEQFYAPGLAGLTVPVVAAAPGGGPSARWVMYLQSADGRRERRDLAAWVDPPGGPRLWLHPSPGAPSVHCPPGWSADGRRAWLAGAAAPDPAAVFGRLADGFTRYVDWPAGEAAGAAATLALWTLLTYCHQAWPAVPYLHVGGPLGSGKSRVMEVLARVAFRPLSTSNLTAPALFRTLHDRGGVVLYDEAERLRQSAPDRQEVLSLLLAGYRRGGRATRLESVGDSFRAVGFDVYGPKALACIAGLPPALASRCVPLTMFRAAPGAAAARRLPDDDPEGWRSLRDDLHALALGHGAVWPALAAGRDVCPPGVDGRAAELWQPLLALAGWLDGRGAGGLLDLLRGRAAAAAAAGREGQTPEADETLLEVVAEMVREGRAPTPGEILRGAGT